MDIEELAVKAGTSVRMVRYLIAKKFVQRPEYLLNGLMSSSFYDDHHLTQICVYLRLKAAGLSQKEVAERTKNRSTAEILAGLEEVVYEIAPGIELRVIVSLVPADVDVGQIMQRFLGGLSVLGIDTVDKENADAERENI